MAATPQQLAEMRQVNTAVNAVPYVELPGSGQPPDWWTDMPTPGDSWVCRDYTQMKADQLKTLGWLGTDLTVVLCWCEPGTDTVTANNPQGRGYHAVLACDASGDTWILDSRAADIYLWTQKPFDYLWYRQQIPGTTEFRDVSVTGLSVLS